MSDSQPDPNQLEALMNKPWPFTISYQNGLYQVSSNNFLGVQAEDTDVDQAYSKAVDSLRAHLSDCLQQGLPIVEPYGPANSCIHYFPSAEARELLAILGEDVVIGEFTISELLNEAILNYSPSTHSEDSDSFSQSIKK